MQAITTKYIGPRNVRGSRVKATAQAGSIIIDWNDALNSDANHANAACALASKFGWHGTWFGGHLPNGDSVWVCYDINQPNHIRQYFTVQKRDVA